MSLMFLVPVIPILLFIIGAVVKSHRNAISAYGKPMRVISGYSRPARKVIAAYMSLPAENRPHGDIYEIVGSLDKKYGGVSDVDAHFRQHGQSRESLYEMSWSMHDGCYSYYRNKECDRPEYKQLVDSFTAIEESLAKQRHELMLSGIAGALSMAEQMVADAKQEVEIIDGVTKEIMP